MSYVYCGWLDSALKWILNNIISPVFNCIKGVLSSVFSFIYSNVLGPILDKTVYAAGRWLWERILDNFFSAMYSLAKMALQILDCLSDLFDTLLGVQPVIFKGEETTLLRAFLNMDAVRRAFWYINFFALGLAVIFAIYGVTRSMLDFDFENKRPVSRVMSSLLSSVLNLFTVQLAVFGIIYLAEAILTGLNSAMALAGGAAGNTTLGRMIFVLGTLNAANDESFNLSSDAVQSGSKIVGPTDPIRSKFFESSGLNPYKLSDVKIYFNIRKLDYFILIGLGLVFAFLLLIALIAVVRRLFNLLLLYIVSPLFAATIPLDDGEHFGKWRNLFVGTCFTGYGMLVAMKLYLLICPTIMGSELTMSASVELNFVCKVVFLLGGLWAVYKSSSMITSLISAEAGNAEGEAMAKGEEVGNLVKGGLWSLLKAGDRSKNKEGKEGQDGQDGKLGEGSQRFNGKNTGAAGTGDHGKDNAFQGDMRNRNDKLEGAGKKDDKSKSSKTGKLGAENRTLDKLRKQFDMDNTNAGDLDKEKENKPEAQQNKNKNAFKGGKGKTTDSLGLGAGKNKKSMDALRSKLGFDAAPKAAEAGDVETESELEKALNGQNKPGTGAVKGKAGGQKGKLEGQDGKKAGSVAATGSRRVKDDSGYTEQHSKLMDLLDKDEVGTGRFGGKNQGLDNADLINKNRPTLNQVGGSWKDTSAQGVNVPVDVPAENNTENNKKDVFTGTGTNPSKQTDTSSKLNLAENKMDAPKGNKDTNIPKTTNKVVDPTVPVQDPTVSAAAAKENDKSVTFTNTNTTIPKVDTAEVKGSETGFGAVSDGVRMGSNDQTNEVSRSNAQSLGQGQETGPQKFGQEQGMQQGVGQGFDPVSGQQIVQPDQQTGVQQSNMRSKVNNIPGISDGVHQSDPTTAQIQTFGQGQGVQQSDLGGAFNANDVLGGNGVSQSNPNSIGGQSYATNNGVSPSNLNPGGVRMGSNDPTGGVFNSNVQPEPGTGNKYDNKSATGSNVNNTGDPVQQGSVAGAGQGYNGNGNIQSTNKKQGPAITDMNQQGGVGNAFNTDGVPGGNGPAVASNEVGMRSNNQTNGTPNQQTQAFGQQGATAAANGVEQNLDPTTAQTQTFGQGQGIPAGGMSYVKDDSDYVSSRAGAYRSDVLGGSTQASNGPTLMNNEMSNGQGFNRNAAENSIHQTVGGQTTQTDEGVQSYTGGNTTVNMRSNNFASNGNVGYNNIHQSVDENVGTGSGSYARDDSSFDYGRSGLNEYRKGKGIDSIDSTPTGFTAGNGTQYTYTQTVRTEVKSSAGFEKSESTVEKEVNGVATETQKIHEKAQQDIKNNNNNSNKDQGKK